MKEVIFLISLLSLSLENIAQQSLVANPKNNIIYNGVYTPIQVMLPICDYDSLLVTTSHGNLKKIMNNYYALTVCEAEQKELFIFIKAFHNKNLIYEDKSNFRIKLVPNPKPILSCGRRTVKQKTLSECLGIDSIFDNFDAEAYSKVKEFRVKHLRDGIAINQWKNNGGTFEKITLQNLEKTKNGDIVIFENILAECDCDGLKRDIGEIVININEK